MQPKRTLAATRSLNQTRALTSSRLRKLVETRVLLAHKGYSALYPDNTLLSFRKALEAGVNGIELDVVRSSDGVLVVHHDSYFGVTDNGTGNVHERDWAYISTLDASYPSKFGSTFTGREDCKVPTLAQVLDEFKGKPIFIFIEAKDYPIDYGTMGTAIAQMILEKGMEKQAYLFSGIWNYIDEARTVSPLIKTGKISSTGTNWESVRDQLLAKGHNFISGINTSFLSERVQGYLAAGIETNAWTVNTQVEIQAVIDMGVTSITSDYCDRMLTAATSNGLTLARP